jgi:hypothetical protein
MPRMPRFAVVRLTIVFAVAAFLLFAASAVVHHWNRDVERFAGLTTSGNADTPSSLAPLLSGQVEPMIGDVVFLNDVRVKPGPKSDIFVVSGSARKHMLVVSDNTKHASALRRVDIKGQIRRLPTEWTLRREWHLTPEQARSFGEQQIYVAAEYMRKQHEPASSD